MQGKNLAQKLGHPFKDGKEPGRTGVSKMVVVVVKPSLMKRLVQGEIRNLCYVLFILWVLNMSSRIRCKFLEASRVLDSEKKNTNSAD